MIKLAKPVLAALLLLALAPVAGAAAPSASDLQPAVETIALDDLFAAEGCSAAETLATPATAPATETADAALDGAEPMPLAVLSCGSCSEPACRGARRGQFCGINKHCNIFSGGFMCPTGGWECQCRAGVLP